MDFEQLQKMALDCGFTHACRLNVDAIQLKEDVREMCAADQCGQYGKNWSCPPACGSLEACRARLKLCDQVLPLGVGCCTRCKKCTCPDEPCRMPEKRVSSMEAYGMLVMQVCKDSGIGYYYGPDHLAYTSCFLFENA